MTRAINAIPYSPSIKVGLQFKRRFWEQDGRIYGGISYTDLPHAIISYSSSGYGSAGKGVLLGAYVFGVHAYGFASLAPSDRLAKVLEYGTQVHPQYTAEYENGVSVGAAEDGRTFRRQHVCLRVRSGVRHVTMTDLVGSSNRSRNGTPRRVESATLSRTSRHAERCGPRSGRHA
jgi:hypothetical protein